MNPRPSDYKSDALPAELRQRSQILLRIAEQARKLQGRSKYLARCWPALWKSTNQVATLGNPAGKSRTSTAVGLRPNVMGGSMKTRGWMVVGAGILLAGIGFWGYARWSPKPEFQRNSLLASMPVNASTIIFADVGEFRGSPFAAQLRGWVPRQEADPEYTQFLQATGFDYERDLNHVALALIRNGRDNTSVFALADGRFDANKIRAYALQSGTREWQGAREIFSVPGGASRPSLSFTFLRKDRIALTNGPDLAALLTASPSRMDAREWQERFDRLAGSPLFVVIRREGASGSLLPGFESSQLSTLLAKLPWITLAGKPGSGGLEVIAEGECPEETTQRQLEDFLKGVLLLAQAGLAGPKIRQQLDPQTRDAYLELLQGAEVSRIDRGETKAVRLIFEVTPKFLEAVRTLPLLPSPQTPANQPPRRPRHRSRPAR